MTVRPAESPAERLTHPALLETPRSAAWREMAVGSAMFVPPPDVLRAAVWRLRRRRRLLGLVMGRRR